MPYPPLIALMALQAAAAAPAAPGCGEARRAAPEMAACAEAPGGVALAGTPARAEQLAALGRAGEARFRLHFGRSPPRYAVAEFEPGASITERHKALNAAGFKRTLPWFSREGFRTEVKASLRRGIEAAAKARGLPAADVEAQVEKAIASQAEQLGDYGADNSERATVPHELGHGWFTETFWPGFHVDGRGHYGGPGPDWLDETAAVLMESGDSAEVRRGVFVTVYRGKGTGMLAGFPAAKLIDLPAFLTMIHPAAGQNQAEAEEARQTGRPIIKIMAGAEAQKLGAAAPLFYSQSRVFADYLLDRTGDPKVFADIATAFGRNETMDAWLAREGRARGLPATVSGLDKDWRAWLQARFGPPSA